MCYSEQGNKNTTICYHDWGNITLPLYGKSFKIVLNAIMFSLKYAIKSITRRKKKNFGVVLAIAIGVTLLVGAQVGATGIEQAFTKSWLNSTYKVDYTVIDPVNEYFPQNLTDKIEGSSDSRLDSLQTVSGRLQYKLPYYSQGQYDKQILTNGIDPTEEGFGHFYDMDGDKLDITKLLNNSQSGNVIISNTMAKSMDLSTGDTIKTSIPDGNGSSVSTSFNVAAIYDDDRGRGQEGVFEDGTQQLYVHINDLQSKLIPKMSDYINRIEVVLDDKLIDRSIEAFDVEGQTFPGKKKIESAMDATKEIVKNEYPYAIVFSDRVEASNEIKDDIGQIRNVLNLFVVMLNVTALLLIVNVQSMSVEDRRNQTAVLRALGTSRWGIFRIFMLESLILGVFGAFIGLGSGMVFGQWVQDVINTIFGLGGNSDIAPIDQSILLNAFFLGTFLAIVTAVVPAYHGSGKSISNELRGIEEPEEEENTSKKSLYIGIFLTVIGLYAARNVGEFWTEEAWSTFDNQVNIMFALGLTFAGIGLILTQIIHTKVALNLSSISFYGLGIFTLFVGIDLIEEGNGNLWLTVILLFVVIGSTMFVIVNFEYIMAGINFFLNIIPSLRGVSQVSTTSMVGKKRRMTLVYTIFTIILILNIFIASTGNTFATNNVDQYNWRSQGVDIVVKTDIPNSNVTRTIEQIPEVTQVFAFRSAFVPVYWENPNPNNTHFDPNEDINYRRVVEVKESTIKPTGRWDDQSLPLSFVRTNEDMGYNIDSKMEQDKHMNLTKTMFNDFFNGKTREDKVTYTNDNGDVVDSRVETQQMVLGGFFTATDNPTYLQTLNQSKPVQPVIRAGAAFDMMGDFDMFGGSVMVPPDIASILPAFQKINGPNLFLVRTSNNYHDSDDNQLLAQTIEEKINDLSNPSSLSSQEGTLIGATTKIVKDTVQKFFDREADVWSFFETFTAVGLILGGAGMAIIAIRTVSERTREIGMMRAIGFSSNSVVASVAMELTIISLPGLVMGMINGMLFTEAFSSSIMGVDAAYPMDKFLGYSLAVFFITIFAGLVPGIRASKIPPSEALRYTG